MHRVSYLVPCHSEESYLDPCPVCLLTKKPKQSQWLRCLAKDDENILKQSNCVNTLNVLGCVLTPVYERKGAVLVSPVAPGVVGRVEVDHEVRFLPAVFLQCAAELFEAPHDLQHQPGTTDLPIGAVAVWIKQRQKNTTMALETGASDQILILN